MQDISKTRSKKAKMNIGITLAGQFVTAVCGLIVPRLLLSAYGSEAYGATTSIAQFLGYIMLLEGGIGGVAKAALYKPIAQNDVLQMSRIVSEVRRYFRIIAYVFTGYVLLLTVFFKSISHIESLDWLTSFLLVGAISISSFAEYFLGIANAVFLQANQKTYITNAVSYITTAMNALATLLLVRMGASLIVVKLASSCVFAAKPVILQWYVKKNYKLQSLKVHETVLKDKWEGLGQQLASFLHANTDVVVLTIFADLKYVAVYAVYNMIVTQIQKITSAFATGMEALFGDMYARNEKAQLDKTFGMYDTMISMTSVTLFSVTAVMITPFVLLYSEGIHDANYDVPLFGFLLTVAAFFTAVSAVYPAMAIAAGHFRQTRVGAYGEAVVNVVVSLLLVSRYNLLGVAIGTVAATAFRAVFYAYYLSKEILHRRLFRWVKRETVNIGTFCAVFISGRFVLSQFTLGSYVEWIFAACIVTVIAMLLSVSANFIWYRQECLMLYRRVCRKKRLCEGNTNNGTDE